MNNKLHNLIAALAHQYRTGGPVSAEDIHRFNSIMLTELGPSNARRFNDRWFNLMKTEHNAWNALLRAERDLTKRLSRGKTPA